MITIELGELYGLADERELINTITELKQIGMADVEIQDLLNRRRKKKDDDT